MKISSVKSTQEFNHSQSTLKRILKKSRDLFLILVILCAIQLHSWDDALSEGEGIEKDLFLESL